MVFNPVPTAELTFENLLKDESAFLTDPVSLSSLSSVDFNFASSFAVLASNRTINSSVAINYPFE